MRGAPVRTAQELLGHSTIEMTTQYAHPTPDTRRDAVKLLDVKEAIVLTWTSASSQPARLAGDKAALTSWVASSV